LGEGRGGKGRGWEWKKGRKREGREWVGRYGKEGKGYPSMFGMH